MREVSMTTRLRRAGFLDPSRAAALLADGALEGLPLAAHVEDLRQMADPDQGLLALIRLAEACREAGATELLAATLEAEGPRKRLFAVLGLSTALGNRLSAHPQTLSVLKDEPVSRDPGETDEDARAEAATGIPTTSLTAERRLFLQAVHADPDAAAPVSRLEWNEGVAALRRHYYTRVCALAAADLTSVDTRAAVDRVASSLSDIVGGALEAGLALARAGVEGSLDVAFSVIAMGKTGAREVNYVSDVDVVYVAEPRRPDASDPTQTDGERPGLDEAGALAVATKMATLLAKAVSAPGSEPALWQLDANLRPEGKDGPLVRTLASHLEYYRRWAKGWEFQALLKARPIAGDMELGQAYVDGTREFVWSAASRENFVEDSRAMRRRVERTVAGKNEERQLKLGKGGLRDVEFTIQLLQLVHGRTDATLRLRPTLSALAALRDGGYVSRADADRLDRDYRTLRLLEHRIQLQRLKRSHLVPAAEGELRRLARSMGIEGLSGAEDLEGLWNEVRRDVRALHQEIYYRPLLPLAARLSPDDITLDERAAKERLAAIGFSNPAGALRHIATLTEGVSRAAAICRQLLPIMLGWFAEAPDPDSGLLAFRVLYEKAGANSYFMRTLRDGGAAAERLCHVLASSKYLAQEIPELPESVAWLANLDDLAAPTRAELEGEMESMLGRRSIPEDIAQAGRYLRRREMLRAGLALVLGAATGETSRRSVSLSAGIAVHAALAAAIAEACGEGEPLNRYLVVAMGRMGSQEMCLASDADLMFVYEPACESGELAAEDLEQCAAEAAAVAKGLRRFLSGIGPEPPLPADFDLRPEGKAGPIERTLDSYAEYYERWAATWEHQALLRARPCAGSQELGRRFEEMIAAYRYPAGGLNAAQMREIRLMKARVETERIPRGIRPERHLKLGRGGQSDIEWTVQLLQIAHAGSTPALRVTSTLQALRGAREAGLVSEDVARILAEAWERASALRDFNFLATGRANPKIVDVLPGSFDQLAAVAYLSGREAREGARLEEEYLRATRRARKVVEKLFYG